MRLTLTPSLLLLESLPFFVEPAPFLCAHCTRRSPRPWRLGTADLFPPPVKTRLLPLNMAPSPVVPCPELPAPTRAQQLLPPLLCFRPPGLEAAYLSTQILFGGYFHLEISKISTAQKFPSLSEMAVVVGFHRKTRFLHYAVGVPRNLASYPEISISTSSVLPRKITARPRP